MTKRYHYLTMSQWIQIVVTIHDPRVRRRVPIYLHANYTLKNRLFNKDIRTKSLKFFRQKSDPIDRTNERTNPIPFPHPPMI